MNSTLIMTALDGIAGTSSRTEKETLLGHAASDETFRRVLRAAYDPFVTYGLTISRAEGGGTAVFTEATWSLLDRLADRTLTGNDAQAAFRGAVAELEPQSAELLRRIVNKDLRAGISDKTINRVVPKLIPVFDVMLADRYETRHVKRFPVAVEPKLDGVRAVAFLRDGKARFFTRSGKPLPAIEHLGEPLVAMVDTFCAALTDADRELVERYRSAFADRTLAFDGEVMTGLFNKTVGEVRRKSEAATDARFYVFDILPEIALTGDDPVFPEHYRTRRHLLERFFEVNAGTPRPIKKVPVWFADDEAAIHLCYENFRAKGLEGAIVKPPNGFYHRRRCREWLKLKAEETEDLRVIGAFEGEGKYAGKLGGLIVDRAGVEVRVGGGFSDQQREALWLDREVLGRLIEVEYHEVTPDGSLRHPRFRRFRDDKDDRLRDVA